VNRSFHSHCIERPLPLRQDECMVPKDVADGSAGTDGRDISEAAIKGDARLPADGSRTMRAAVVGASVALLAGLLLDIGWWTAISRHLLGSADAQEAPVVPERVKVQSTPSAADEAALRYFAGEGEIERLEAELRRLRALYPDWSPPRDLLEPQGEDEDLQRLHDLVADQRWEEARQAIAERRQRDPGWNPPAPLLELLDNADARIALRAESEAGNYSAVLSIAEENEQILTCEDADSLWRVAEAFAMTGRRDRAFDAYAYLVDTCEPMDVRAATVEAAAETLDPEAVSRLFELKEMDGEDGSLFAETQLEIIRDAVSRGGGQPIPPEWLETLADDARTGGNLADSMLIGDYLLRQNKPAEAAQWFRFALDNGKGAPAAEGYIVALQATGNREDAFLAREVAYLWREQTPDLMEAYLDAMASLLTADELGDSLILDVEQEAVDRFVPVVIQQRDAEGAEALGWYAFNTCQFGIAEEWFISSASWVPTEEALSGLARTRLRLGDQEGFEEVVEEWGPIYSSVNALATPADVDPGAPDEPAADVALDELDVSSVVCDPQERERLRRRNAEQDRSLRRQVLFSEAGPADLAPMKAGPHAEPRSRRSATDRDARP